MDVKIKYGLLIWVLLGIVACGRDLPVDDQPVFDPTAYQLVIPQGLPPMNIPADNPLTVEGVELGRMLFYDKMLSIDGTISCASCHGIDFAFSDHGKKFSTGVGGAVGNRTSMPLVNIAYSGKFMWDGRANTLEEQILLPIEDHREMAHSLPELIEALKKHADYPGRFFDAFGTKEIEPSHIGKAIAQFLRTIVSADSKFDRVMRGKEFFTFQEAQGYQLFNALDGADCFHCHMEGNGLFSDFQFRNNGLTKAATIHDFPDPGLGGITGRSEDYGLFKTPSLRNIALSAPYMHDGRFETLMDVLDHYSEGLQKSPNINPAELEFIEKGGVQLTLEQKQMIIAFLHTLTDTTVANNPKFQNPFK